MKNNEKTIIAGAGVLLAYFLIEKNKKKEINMSNVSISPTEFFEK